MVGKKGVERIIELPLDDFEKNEFLNGANSVKEAISNLPI